MAREIGILAILANAFVYTLETYAGLGLVFGVLFVCLGVQRLDPEARGLLILGRMKFANVAFEYNRRRTFEGTIETRPYPTRLVARPGEVGPEERDSRFVPSSIVVQDSAPPSQTATRDLGPVTLRGEIVDSKCYLGVMNLGSGLAATVRRCLSGGIPPIFVAEEAQLLLIGLDGRALERELLREFVAEPVTILGELLQRGDSRLLKIDPRALRHTRTDCEHYFKHHDLA